LPNTWRLPGWRSGSSSKNSLAVPISSLPYDVSSHNLTTTQVTTHLGSGHVREPVVKWKEEWHKPANETRDFDRLFHPLGIE
jgi:hypothetical protein